MSSGSEGDKHWRAAVVKVTSIGGKGDVAWKMEARARCMKEDDY